MKTNDYTKIMLTIIAVCLIVIAVRGTDFVGTANARSDDPVWVVVVGSTRHPISTGRF